MEERPKEESKTRKLLKLLLKIVVTVICLWYVSGKIDFSKAGDALQDAHGIYLILALLAFIVSKLIAAARLNLYFRNIGIHLPETSNLKLYWMGMFYNLFLPGSISGDAYKVVLLSKKYAIPYRKTTAAVLLDRFSGLLGLFLILAAYSLVVFSDKLLVIGIIVAAAASVLILYFIIKYFFRDFTSSYIPTLLLGLLVQIAQVICVYLIMAALQIPLDKSELIFIFLLSSMVAVLPLTIGGLGARELVFLEGSRYFGLDQESSVVISILFYLITLITSAWGLYYVYNEPLKKRAVDHKEE